MDWGIGPVAGVWGGVVQFGWAVAGGGPMVTATRTADRRREWRVPGTGFKETRVAMVRV
jgi:hypothetical protein